MNPQPSPEVVEQIESVIPLGINKGDIFSSLEEIEAKIEEVSRAKYLSFYKRDSRTIQTARDRVKRPLDESLVFYQVKYNCIKGGQKYVHKGKGFRPPKRSCRSEELCLAHIHFTVTQAGNQFEVTSINNVHNHEVSLEAYRRLPLNKKLDEETKQVAVSLLNLKADKQIINEKSYYDTKLHITASDINTLYAGRIKEQIMYKQIVNKLIHRKDCHLLVDDEDAFQGLFFCNERMKSTFGAYPEIICIDEVHKFLSKEAAMYTMQIEDGNGECQVVGVAILVTRQKPYVQWFLDTFKSVCSWENIQIIMAPQSFDQEDDLLRDTFPQAEICTNIFETVRMCQNNKRTNKGFSSRDQSATINLLIKLLQAESEEDFENIKDTLIKPIASVCLQYLEGNWDNFKQEWNPLMGKRIKDFLKTSHALLYFLLAITKKSPGQCSLIDSIDSLFFAIEMLENERAQRVNNMLQRQKFSSFSSNGVKKKYQDMLTEYAFLKVVGELDQMEAVEAVDVSEDSDDVVTFQTKTPDVQKCFKTTSSDCTCAFYEAFTLPCRHLFHVRQHLSKDLFMEDLCATKWTMDYYLMNCPNSRIYLQDTISAESVNDLEKSPEDNKYNMIVSKCSTLAGASMQAPDEIFPDILTFLDNVSTTLTCKNYQLLQNFNKQCRKRVRSDSDSTVDNVELIPEETNSEHSNLNVTNHVDVSTDNNEADDDVLILDDTECRKEQFTFGRKRGRPRKEGNEKISRRDDLPFFKRPAKERRSVILSFLLRNTNDVYKNQPLEIRDLLPEEKIDNRIAYADLTAIRKYFSDDCWTYIEKLQKDKEVGDWFCCVCRVKFAKTDSSIECSYCLNWSHASCSIGLGSHETEQGGYFKCAKCYFMT
ncbi:uncharacterized protein LOC126745850 [Anthonomus grandis grandis]|uniref:uncharacterized protein LOC126745850 n=1 Tax=Anthonomus grandis grandis TaxID=2921223 RepID=UPI0021652D7A|nr:uncharacterized protein LOC126745850 [Anthonomus grandis grandis]